MRQRSQPECARILSVLAILSMLGFLAGCEANSAERNNTGNDQVARAEYEAAVRSYQVAQALEPDAPVPYYNAGIALSVAGDYETAALALEEALEKADDALIKEAYYNLGIVYFSDSRFFEAVDAFREALLIDPNDAEVRYNYELALLYAIEPTPENQQQQSQPEESESDESVTPTPQPGAFDGPTPTPPPQESPPDASQTPAGGTGDFFTDEPSTLVPQEQGRFTREEAERLLDLLEQDQQALSAYLEQVGDPSGDPVENDW
jgi:Ca-activated chloride channel family protein